MQRNAKYGLITAPLFAGVERLWDHRDLTINGTTVEPKLWYQGGLATATAWPSRGGHGADLGIGGSGAAPTPDVPALHLGNTAVTVTAGGKFFEHPSNGVDHPSTGDLVFRYVGTRGSVVNRRIFTTNDAGTTARSGLECWLNSSNQLTMVLCNGASFAVINSATLGTGLVDAICIVDRSGFGQWYVNGAVSGAAVDVSSMSGTLTNASYPLMLLGHTATGAGDYTASLIALYEAAAWLDSHLQPTMAKEQSSLFFGTTARHNHAALTPETQSTRTSIAYAQRPLPDVAGEPLRLFPVGANFPRSEMVKDPVTGLWLPGFRLEPEVENVCTYSEDYDSWISKTNITIDNAAAAALDGETTLNKLTETTATGWHRVGGNIAARSTDDVLIHKVYVQDGTRRYVFVSVWNSSAGAHGYGIVDLQTGTVTEAASSNTSYLDNIEALCVPVPGWTNMYRIEVKALVRPSGNGQQHCAHLALSNSPTGIPSSYAGDTGKNLYAWGSMLLVNEERAGHSYIKTTTGSATRAADGYLAWNTYVPDEFTAMITFNMSSHTPTSDIDMLYIDDGYSTTNRIVVAFESSTGKLKAYTMVDEVIKALVVPNKVVTDGGTHRAGLKYSKGRLGLIVDGIELIDSDIHVPGMDRVSIQPSGALVSLQWLNKWVTGQPRPIQPDVIKL